MKKVISLSLVLNTIDENPAGLVDDKGNETPLESSTIELLDGEEKTIKLKCNGKSVSVKVKDEPETIVEKTEKIVEDSKEPKEPKEPVEDSKSPSEGSKVTEPVTTKKVTK